MDISTKEAKLRDLGFQYISDDMVMGKNGPEFLPDSPDTWAQYHEDMQWFQKWKKEFWAQDAWVYDLSAPCEEQSYYLVVDGDITFLQIYSTNQGGSRTGMTIPMELLTKVINVIKGIE
jgi:hypothetical protein